MSTQEIINELENIDLSKYPLEEVAKLLKELGKIPIIVETIPIGYTIIRARVNCNSERFTKIDDLTYKSAKLNTTYQRAHIPNTTMFYAAILPPELYNSDHNSSRVIAFAEVSNLLRDKSILAGEQVITFSRWAVKKELNLVTVVGSEIFPNDNEYLKSVKRKFNEVLNTMDKDLREDLIVKANFLSKEFSKKNLKDYGYMISAIYTNQVLRPNPEVQIDGIIYPSVQADLKGMNVAINPESVIKCLRLDTVGECTAYKNDRIIIDNETDCILEENQTEFTLKPVHPKYHIGRINVLRDLYPLTAS